MNPHLDSTPIDLRHLMDDDGFLLILRSCWSKNVSFVSPGTVGMICQYLQSLPRGLPSRPIERCDLDSFVRRCPVARWVTDEIGNDWIVRA